MIKCIFVALWPRHCCTAVARADLGGGGYTTPPPPSYNFTLSLLLRTASSVGVTVTCSWSLTLGNQLFSISSILRMISTYFSLKKRRSKTKRVRNGGVLGSSELSPSTRHVISPSSRKCSEGRGAQPALRCVWGGERIIRSTFLTFWAYTWLRLQRLHNSV